MPATLADVNEALQKAGLTPRGAFHPQPEDGVPELAIGRPVMTLVLADNAGPTMWAAFSTERDPAFDLLDDWSRDVLEPIAKTFGAKALFPLSDRRWRRERRSAGPETGLRPGFHVAAGNHSRHARCCHLPVRTQDHHAAPGISGSFRQPIRATL